METRFWAWTLFFFIGRICLKQVYIKCHKEIIEEIQSNLTNNKKIQMFVFIPLYLYRCKAFKVCWNTLFVFQIIKIGCFKYKNQKTPLMTHCHWDLLFLRSLQYIFDLRKNKNVDFLDDHIMNSVTKLSFIWLSGFVEDDHFI